MISRLVCTVTLVVDSSTSDFEGPSIAIGVDGYPVVSYLDQVNNKLKILHCGDVLCTP